MKTVGTESAKTFDDKMNSGFFTKFMSGTGLDIGGRGYNNADPILPGAKLVELGDPGYDGLHLPYPNNSQDYIYSSHCLEHIADYKTAIQEWLRVVKSGG